MNIGEIITVTIDDMNERGIGVARVDGAVVFVPQLVSGDVADIQITSHEKNYYTGKTVKLLTASPFRTSPVCSVSDCGGCSLCHITYEFENSVKKNTVRNAFRRNGLPFDIVEDTVHPCSRTNYRNKITVHYSEKDDSYGLYSDGTNDTIPFSCCAICPQIMSDIVRFTNENMSLLPSTRPDPLIVRTDSSGNAVVSLCAEKLISIYEYKSAVLERFDSVSNVVLVVGGVSGSFINDKIGNIDMRFSSEAFRQVNSSAFELLLGIVKDEAEKSTHSCIADLYCGSGVIGLTLAKAFPTAQVYGIEINPDAVSDAGYNAEANGLYNIEFFCGDSASFKKKLGGAALPDLIVVDPPRAGLSKEMRSGLAELSPESIIYVSCNPQTLARDLSSLSAYGYEIERTVPVNMFPMTSHCETVVTLKRI